MARLASAYADPPGAVGGTLALLRWYRAFAASGALTAADPYGHRGDYITKTDVPRHLKRLLDAAINRKGGVPDDPDTRFSCCRLNHLGRPMRFARGDAQRLLRLLRWRVNMPRLRVYTSELGQWQAYLLRRLPERFVDNRRGER